MDITKNAGRLIHQVQGSSAVKAWAFEPDRDGEGGWLVVKWQNQKHGKVSRGKHFNSWVLGLLLAAEQCGRSVGRLMNSLLGHGDLARERQAKGLEMAPGYYREGATVWGTRSGR